MTRALLAAWPLAAVVVAIAVARTIRLRDQRG